MYNMLAYTSQQKFQAEEQKRGGYLVVDKVLLPEQQHQSLLQWINSWATANYEFNTMKNALRISMEDLGMRESTKTIDGVNSTTGMLKVQAIDRRMTADEVMHFIVEKITLQHHKEAKHQDRGGQHDVRHTDRDVAEGHASPNRIPQGQRWRIRCQPRQAQGSTP